MTNNCHHHRLQVTVVPYCLEHWTAPLSPSEMLLVSAARWCTPCDPIPKGGPYHPWSQSDLEGNTKSGQYNSDWSWFCGHIGLWWHACLLTAAYSLFLVDLVCSCTMEALSMMLAVVWAGDPSWHISTLANSSFFMLCYQVLALSSSFVIPSFQEMSQHLFLPLQLTYSMRTRAVRDMTAYLQPKQNGRLLICCPHWSVSSPL